jgi:hypothetical protein
VRLGKVNGLYFTRLSDQTVSGLPGVILSSLISRLSFITRETPRNDYDYNVVPCLRHPIFTTHTSPLSFINIFRDDFDLIRHG